MPDSDDDPKNWSPLRQRFEALRAIKKIITGPRETISEAMVREAIAEQYGIKPEEVTWKQIQFEVSGMLQHYPAITVIPTQQSSASAQPEITQNQTARFTPLDENYQTIEFEGHQYALTRIQSIVVRVLHEAYKAGRRAVGIKEIYKALKSLVRQDEQLVPWKEQATLQDTDYSSPIQRSLQTGQRRKCSGAFWQTFRTSRDQHFSSFGLFQVLENRSLAIVMALMALGQPE